MVGQTYCNKVQIHKTTDGSITFTLESSMVFMVNLIMTMTEINCCVFVILQIHRVIGKGVRVEMGDTGVC